MAEAGVSPGELFASSPAPLAARLGAAAPLPLQQSDLDAALERARQEAKFVEAHGIRVMAMTDPDYPASLYATDRAPLTLYALGPCPLAGERMLSVVGTRRCTAYGANFVRKLIEELAGYFPDLVIVSGLAYGIDSAAHEAALACGLRTIGVVAHGLDTIYPAANRELAARMVRAGGAVVSEYCSGTTPYQKRFLERNRIVAALGQGVFVAESDLRGGAMSTARTAHSYGREVMALPGRATDEASRGCNSLIRRQQAVMVTTTAEVMETLGWTPTATGEAVQPSLFPELDGDARRVVDLLRAEARPMPLDELHARLGIPVPTLTSLLADLEYDAILARHPGNRFTPIL